MKRPLSDDAAELIARRFRALSDPTRREILELMASRGAYYKMYQLSQADM